MKVSKVDVLDLVVETICRETSPDRIILFGSQNRGSAKPESDLDLAVIQKRKLKLGQKGKVFLALSRLGYDWKPEIDIHIFSQKEFADRLKAGDVFAREIEKGRVVYQAGN
jgi:predicted nucleotidyltransferase